MDESAEPLLSRWSRLKQEARSDRASVPVALPTPPMPAPAPVAPEPPRAETQPPEDEAVRPEDLPDIETLDYHSDFTLFLRKGVPEELKRLALRKLWRSDPILACRDGLNDYDQDYSELTRLPGETESTAKYARDLVKDAHTGHRSAAVEPPRPPPQMPRSQAPAIEAAAATGSGAEPVEPPPDRRSTV